MKSVTSVVLVVDSQSEKIIQFYRINDKMVSLCF